MPRLRSASAAASRPVGSVLGASNIYFPLAFADLLEIGMSNRKDKLSRWDAAIQLLVKEFLQGYLADRLAALGLVVSHLAFLQRLLCWVGILRSS